MIESAYEYLDHPSDVIIEARGRDLLEALANAGIALFNYMCIIESIEAKLYREICINVVEDNKQLLYIFLDECLYLYGSEYFIAKDIKIELNDNKLKVTLKGDIFDKNKHIAGREIKAITKHGISVNISDETTTLMILVDI